MSVHRPHYCHSPERQNRTGHAVPHCAHGGQGRSVHDRGAVRQLGQVKEWRRMDMPGLHGTRQEVMDTIIIAIVAIGIILLALFSDDNDI